jgi:MBG domain-containing protein/ankyrin repeat protein
LTSTTTDLTRVAGEGVGVRDITGGSFSAPSANYSAPTLAGTPTLTIDPTALSFALTTPGQTKVYGADDPALAGMGVTLAGLVNDPAVVTWNGTVAVDDSAVTGTLTSLTRVVGETVAASPYAITAGAVTLSGSDANYVKSFDATNSPTLAITQVPVSVTANGQTKTYGAADPALTYGAAGLVTATVTDWNSNSTSINDTAAIVFSGGLARAAGETVADSPYAIAQGTLAAIANYSITAFTGNSLTVMPAPLAVTANDASRPVNQPNPPYSATYSGFQFGETPAVLTGVLSLTTTAIITSPAGPYPITPSGQSSTNYAISYVDGTLLVTGGSSPQLPPFIAGLATNQVIGGLEQLGSVAAIGDAGDCSGFYRPHGIAFLTGARDWVCAARDEEPLTRVAAPAARKAQPVPTTKAVPEPTPEMAGSPSATETPPALKLKPSLELAAVAPEAKEAPPVPTTKALPERSQEMAVAAPTGKPEAPRQPELRRDEIALAMTVFPGPRAALKYSDVMTAVVYSDPAAVVELLDRGWWVDRPDSNGRTPLMAAAMNGDLAMTQLLLQRGADPNRRAPDGSVLDYARRSGNAEVMELLLRAGAQ